jgi:hypothetical protein
MNDSPLSTVDTIPASVLPKLPYDRTDPSVATRASRSPADELVRLGADGS